MQITPGFEPPAEPPTEQDCLDYLREMIAEKRTKPGGIGWIYVELIRHFPLARTEVDPRFDWIKTLPQAL